MSTNTIIAAVGIAAAGVAYFYMRSRRNKLSRAGNTGKSEISR